MNLLIVVSLSLLFGASFVENASSIVRDEEEIAKEALECIRRVLNDGDQDATIPKCNPLVINDLVIDLSTLNLTGLSGVISATNIKFEYITTFKLETITGQTYPNGIIYGGDIKYDKLKFSCKYNVHIVNNRNSIKKSGSVSLAVPNIELGAIFNMTTEPRVLKNLSVQLGPIRKTDFRITGFGFIVNPVINALVNSKLPGLINAYHQTIIDLLTPKLVQNLNEELFENKTRIEAITKHCQLP